jgi:hypothetical protein
MVRTSSWLAGVLWLAVSAPLACAGDDAEGTAGGGGVGGKGGSGGKPDASNDAKNDVVLDASPEAPSCTDKVQNGSETDTDCGGSCPGCTAGKKCGQASDCVDGVCTAGACQGATCSDGVQNGGETGVDCGGPCPPTYHGEGCVDGTNGSKVCSSFSPADAGVDDAGNPKFTVTISWNATGGDGKVNYALIYAPGNQIFNTLGVAGGSQQNVCTSGPHSETFELALGDQYTYKIWWADCVKPGACSGCGWDTVIAEGGPFGVAQDLCK